MLNQNSYRRNYHFPGFETCLLKTNKQSLINSNHYLKDFERHRNVLEYKVKKKDFFFSFELLVPCKGEGVLIVNVIIGQ